MTFLEAVEAMKHGKRVRRNSWPQDKKITLCVCNFYWGSRENLEFVFDLEEIEATNWEIYEEPKKRRTEFEEE